MGTEACKSFIGIAFEALRQQFAERFFSFHFCLVFDRKSFFSLRDIRMDLTAQILQPFREFFSFLYDAGAVIR